MSKEYWSPGAGEGGGTQPEAVWNSRGPPRRVPAGALSLIVLVIYAACATQAPMASRGAGGDRSGEPAAESEARSVPRELQPVVVVYAGLVEARGKTRVVALTQEEYQRAVAQLGHRFQVEGTPQEIGMSVHAHPSLSEVMGEAAMAVDGNAIHI